MPTSPGKITKTSASPPPEVWVINMMSKFQSCECAKASLRWETVKTVILSSFKMSRASGKDTWSNNVPETSPQVSFRSDGRQPSHYHFFEIGFEALPGPARQTDGCEPRAEAYPPAEQAVPSGLPGNSVCCPWLRPGLANFNPQEGHIMRKNPTEGRTIHIQISVGEGVDWSNSSPVIYKNIFIAICHILKMSYYVLYTYYIRFAKLYYWNYSGERYLQIFSPGAACWPTLA